MEIRTPDKTRFLKALNRQEYPEVPFLELEMAPGQISRILGRPIRDRPYLIPIEDTIEFVTKAGMDVCNITLPWWLGRERYNDGSGMTKYKEGTIRTPADFSRVTPPDVATMTRRIERFLSLTHDTRLGWILSIPTPCSVIVSAIGFESYYLMVYDNPGFIAELLARTEDIMLPITEQLLQYRPDALGTAVFLADKNGPSMSAEHTQRFILEPLSRHVRLFREAGIPTIIHSDGNNSAFLDAFIAMGITAFHPHEVCTGFDIYASKAKYGDRLSLCGNIDCTGVLLRGSPEAVRQDTLRHLLALSRGGGYLCGSSHDVGDDIPFENLLAMIETVTTFRADTASHRSGP